MQTSLPNILRQSRSFQHWLIAQCSCNVCQLIFTCIYIYIYEAICKFCECIRNLYAFICVLQLSLSETTSYVSRHRWNFLCAFLYTVVSLCVRHEKQWSASTRWASFVWWSSVVEHLVRTLGPIVSHWSNWIFFLTSLSSIKSLWSALADTRQRYDFTLKKTTKILGPATIFPGTEVPVSQCSAIARLLFTFRRKKKK